MKTFATITLLTGLMLGLAACSSDRVEPYSGPTEVKTPPASASLVDPLKVGESAPQVTLRKPNGKEVETAELFARKPTLLIFYRGGWCPYCNTHLGQLAEIEGQLVKLGYQVVAVSPDRPEELKTTLDKGDYDYQLLSDSKMEFSKAFGLAFRVDDGTVEKYQTYGIDLDKASGEHHHLLPVPAVYIVDRRGEIKFAHWSPDYKTRLDNESLLNAAHKAMGK